MSRQPKKVLMVSPYFYPEGGGLENYVYNISKGLVKKGVKVTVMCSTKEGVDRIETIDGIKVIRQKPNFILSNTPLKFNLKYEMRKLVEIEKFDLIHAHTPVPFYADIACSISKEYGLPFFLTYHSGDLKKNHLFMDMISFIYSFFEQRMFEQAKAIMPVSEYPLETFLKPYSDKCVAVSPGVDVRRFKPSNQQYIENTILFVGQISSFHRLKGLDYLLDAMIYLPQKVKLIVVGSGNMCTYYEQKARNLQANVEFRGKLSGMELVKEYQRSILLVLPSISNAEGFGMTIAEAGACGKPVVATKVGGIPYVVKDGETGILVPPKNSKALARAISRIIHNKRFAKNLGNNARHFVEINFNWRNSIKKILDLYAISFYPTSLQCDTIKQTASKKKEATIKSIFKNMLG